MNKKNINHSKHPKTPKRLALKILISIASSLLIIFFISSLYFLTLISTEYKSFPFVTHFVEDKINNNLPKDFAIKIGQSSMKFGNFHKINIKLDDIRLTDLNDKQESVLPKSELEFSIFKLVLFKTFPSKIRIIAPNIEIDQTSGKAKFTIDGAQEGKSSDFLEDLSQIFLSLDNNISSSKFEIVDAKITLRNGKETKIVNLKTSNISLFFSKGYLKLKSNNNLTFDKSASELSFDTNCDFKKQEGLKCDVGFNNFTPSSISSFNEKLKILDKIKGRFNGNINFAVDVNYQISAASFNLSSTDGSFNFPEYFKTKISFQNLNTSGKIDNTAKTISLDNLSCNFGVTQFAMSFSANDFSDPNSAKTMMQFKISNVPFNDLETLWPTFLNQNNVRSWVLGHINGGTVKDGYATMIMGKKNGGNYLQKIESELAFSGLNLEYDKNFPPIHKVDGLAYFNEKMMRIDIAKGEVLDSNINVASVIIPDFTARKTILEISGKIIGKAEDSLKHIDYKSEFADKIDQYLNGDAQTDIDIKIPIIDNLALKDTYIKVLSNIENFNNDYVSKSKIGVSTLKKTNSNNFVTEINLAGANINLKKFGIDKESGVLSNIKTTISFDDGNLYLKKFEWKQGDKGISGSATIKTDPFELMNLNMNNNGFAGSNFDLNYKIIDNSRIINLTGESINFGPFVSQGSGEAGTAKHYPKHNVQVAVGEIKLANNQKLQNVNVSINCDLGICQDGFIMAKLNQKHNANLAIAKPNRKDPTRIKGFIEDISVLTKGFDLSNQIVDGNALVKINMNKDGKLIGKIEIADGFTILKNEVVDRISESDAFSTLKGKIKSSEKIEFDELRIEFDYQNSVLDINTLVASSYLLGFTAKGRINTDLKTIDIKGLIVPGYALNKLFGIGRIPVLGQIIVGEEGGGIFAVRYDYKKATEDKKGEFYINPASAVIPGGIRNIFDIF